MSCIPFTTQHQEGRLQPAKGPGADVPQSFKQLCVQDRHVTSQHQTRKSWIQLSSLKPIAHKKVIPRQEPHSGADGRHVAG